jgi:cell division ATPase FtsA
MSFFSSSTSNKRYGAIFDIGSGSVLVSIVYSNPESLHPQVIWSRREHVPLRNIESLEQSSKAVMTALIDSAVTLDSAGRKVLHKFDAKAEINEVQCSISAPWSYTVTKTINYNQEKPFSVHETLIKELLDSIQTKVIEELTKNEALRDLSLEIVTKENLGITANGYRVSKPEGSTASSLTVSQATVVTQKYLTDSIDDVQKKMLPKADIHKLSFILLFHFINRELLKRKQDTCLVDVTFEATEIGIVREGILTYCTHMPFGSFSLAREIAQALKVPLDEAFGYLHTEKPLSFLDDLSDKQKEEIETILEAFTEKLSNLFKETGDALSIPKHITLHSDTKTESLFSGIIEKAAKRTLKTSPFVVPISQEIIKQMYTEVTKDTDEPIQADTTLLMSAQFFHTQQQKDSFKYF